MIMAAADLNALQRPFLSLISKNSGVGIFEAAALAISCAAALFAAMPRLAPLFFAKNPFYFRNSITGLSV